MSTYTKVIPLAILALLSFYADCYILVPSQWKMVPFLSVNTRLQMAGDGGSQTKEDSFRVIFTALQEYKAQYGDMYVPVSFVVPDNHEEFSRECWGLPLGTRVQAIRSGNAYQKYRSTLNKIRFPWNAKHTRKKRAFERFVLSLGIYNQLKLGSVNDIPYSYRIPREAPWPSDTHGYWLGRKVAEVRRGLIFASPRYQQVLTAVGLEVPHTIVRPLERGKEQDGDTKDSKGVTFGYIGEVGGSGELGEASYQAPSRGNRRRFATVYRALFRYKQLHGHLDVPSKYVVSPSDRANWPAYAYRDLYGLRLGQAVSNIRQGNSYSALFYAAQLDRLGFVWNAREFRAAKASRGDVVE